MTKLNDIYWAKRKIKALTVLLKHQFCHLKLLFVQEMHVGYTYADLHIFLPQY